MRRGYPSVRRRLLSPSCFYLAVLAFATSNHRILSPQTMKIPIRRFGLLRSVELALNLRLTNLNFDLPAFI